MMYFKRYVKAASIIEFVAQRLGKSVDEAYREVIWKLEDAFGDPMRGLEEAVIRGDTVLRNAGIPEEWIEHIVEAARNHVKVKTLRISGIITVRSFEPDGVERIKKVLMEAKKVIDSSGKRVSGRIYNIGSPKYRVDLQGYDYKELESVLDEVVERASKTAKELNVEFSFERLKL